jgi:FMN-dependent NADH-azoreductase
MAKLLHIQTSPRGSRSASQAVAEQKGSTYRTSSAMLLRLTPMRRVLPKWDVFLCPS